jgi:selenide,water dikinase
LIIGLGMPDDAAVWRLDEERMLVVTTDFFTPVVDDAYDYGAIAAANALSDLFAMGADPILALNISAFPADLDLEVISDILRGGAEKVRESGAVIAGGHSIQDREPKYGLVAIGIASERELMTKSNARSGDVLVLTKPLGMGVTTTALKNGHAEAQDVDQATLWMSRLNGPASVLARKFGVTAATDVTGYSLLGHSVEIAEASGVALRFYLPGIPFLANARSYAEAWSFPGGSIDNRAYFGKRVTFADSIDEESRMLLFDAQTSGGLILCVPRASLNAFLSSGQEKGLPLWVVGQVEEGEGVHVEDTAFELAGIDQHTDRLWFASSIG